MNKKGQALVEFVIIFPIIIFIILGVIDYVSIIQNSGKLESKMDNVIVMYKNNDEAKAIENMLQKEDSKIKLSILEGDKYTDILLTKHLEIITPGLGFILGNPYEIKVKRVILNEK